MVHPSELLRTNSVEGREFAAPANILNENPIDCGICIFPCLNRWFNLEKFAKLKVYVVFLSLIAFLHGLTITYFRKTSQIWGKYYNISQDNIDWLIYTNEFFVGLLALLISYWGNRIHRMTWIGKSTIIYAINCVVLIIPELNRDTSKKDTIMGNNLCSVQSTSKSPEENEVSRLAIAILVKFQICCAMATISFISHGITYLDDNAAPKHSAACIGIVLAAREIGKQAGIYFSGFPYYFKVDMIFVSPVWLSFAIVTFISGIIIAMFPRNLPSIVMQKISASILDIATGHEAVKRTEIVDGFFKTLWRLLGNKVLMINILSVVFVQSAFINFNIFEKQFNQSRFFVSNQDNSSLVQLVTNLLKQPLVAISVIASGMVISKAKPRARSLVKYNIVAIILAILFFASGAFLKCDKEIESEYEGVLSSSYCNSHCDQCSSTSFQPVCINNKTYFSPCFGGCSSVKDINSNQIYQNCTCGGRSFVIGNFEGTEGACNAAKCYLFWTLSQANNVFSSALLATTMVTNIVINMRSVKSRDKASALGLEATFLGVIPYLPVKLIYGAISERFCEIRNNGVCRFYSETFGLFLSTSTVIMMVISILLAIAVLFLINFNYDVREIDEDEDAKEMEDMSPEAQERVEESRTLMSGGGRRKNASDEELDLSLANGISNGPRAESGDSLSRDSLLELENVGDDHDSVGSIDSNIGRSPRTMNRRRVLER